MAADEKLSSEVKKLYQTRASLVRQAQSSYKDGKMTEAIKGYNQYLAIIAKVKGVETGKLSPRHFDVKKDATETLLISQVYWDLSKIYDLSPNLKKEMEKSIAQFVRFTQGSPFQVLNAEICRRFLKRNAMKNKQHFEAAYKQIYKGGKKCWVANYAYVENQQQVASYRQVRDELLDYKLGAQLVHRYYQSAPKLLKYLEKRPYLRLPCRLGLFLTSQFLQVCLKLAKR